MQSIQASPHIHRSIAEICDENDRLQSVTNALKDENTFLRAQVDNLSQINVFASNICILSANTPRPGISDLVKKNVNAFVQDARAIVLSAGRGVQCSAQKMIDVVIKICNFIYDHLGEIALLGLIVGGIAIATGLLVLLGPSLGPNVKYVSSGFRSCPIPTPFTPSS